MKTSNLFLLAAALSAWAGNAAADEVRLPAPVLEYSVYILLAFALLVAVGIFFFAKGKNGKSEALSKLMEQGRPEVVSVAPRTPVAECVRQMNEHRIGAMLVMDSGELLGIFTERDALTRVLGTGLDPGTTAVSDVMTRQPITVTPTTTLEEAMAIVTRERVRHLPVVQGGKVVGIVSSGDLTHRLVRDQAREIQELVDVAGRGRLGD